MMSFVPAELPLRTPRAETFGSHWFPLFPTGWLWASTPCRGWASTRWERMRPTLRDPGQTLTPGTFGETQCSSFSQLQACPVTQQVSLSHTPRGAAPSTLCLTLSDPVRPVLPGVPQAFSRVGATCPCQVSADCLLAVTLDRRLSSREGP